MLHRNANHKLLLFIMIGALFLTSCGGSATQETPTVEPELVEDFVPVVSATAIVVPAQWVTLSLPVAGIVEAVLVSEDETVAADQVLVRLQGKEELEAAITAAQLELAAAQRDLDALYKDLDVKAAQALQAVAEAQDAVRDAERALNNLQASSSQADIDEARANVTLAILNVLAGTVIIYGARGLERRRRRLVYLSSGGLVVVALIAFWGTNRIAGLHVDMVRGAKTLFYREGAASTVSIVELQGSRAGGDEFIRLL